MAKKSELTTTDKIAAPPEIRELVEKFAEHRETYHCAGSDKHQIESTALAAASGTR